MSRDINKRIRWDKLFKQKIIKKESPFLVDILAGKDGDKDAQHIKIASRVYILKSL